MVLWAVVVVAVFAIVVLNFAYRDTGPAVVVSAPHFVRPSALPGSLPPIQKPTRPPPTTAATQPLTACRRTIEHGDMHSSVTGWNMKRTLCLNRLAGEFGRMPLVHSRCNIALNASQLYEGS